MTSYQIIWEGCGILDQKTRKSGVLIFLRLTPAFFSVADGWRFGGEGPHEDPLDDPTRHLRRNSLESLVMFAWFFFKIFLILSGRFRFLVPSSCSCSGLANGGARFLTSFLYLGWQNWTTDWLWLFSFGVNLEAIRSVPLSKSQQLIKRAFDRP